MSDSYDPYYHGPKQQQQQQQQPTQYQHQHDHQINNNNNIIEDKHYSPNHGHSHGSSNNNNNNNNINGNNNYNGLPHLRNQIGHVQPYFSTYKDLNNSGGIPSNNQSYSSSSSNNGNMMMNNYNQFNEYNSNSNSNSNGIGLISIDSSITLKHLISNLNRDSDAKKLACWICLMLLFTIYEIFYGAYLESLGLVSDGFHALFDCIGMGIALLAMLVGKKGTVNQEYTYGYDRWEVLGTFSNGCFLLFVSFFLFLESIERLLEPPHIHNHGRVISLATVSLIINIVGVLFFKQKSNERKQQSAIRSENLLTISHHILVDSCTSLGVIFSSLIGQSTGLEISDSLISIIIACIIVYDALPICIRTSAILLQTTPESLKININNAIKDIVVMDGVIDVTEKHFWSHSHGNIIATINVVAKKNCNDQQLVQSIRHRLSFVQDLTVQIDKEVKHHEHHEHKEDKKSHNHHSGHGHSHGNNDDHHHHHGEDCDHHHDHEPVPIYQVQPTSPFSSHFTDIHNVTSPIPLYKSEPEEEDHDDDHHHQHNHDDHDDHGHGHSHSHGHSHNH